MNTAEKPIYSPENVIHFREEREGYVSLVSRAHPEAREIILNRTTNQIMKLCDGTLTLEEVLTRMEQFYPNVPRERIRKDVAGTLGSLTHLGVVTWEFANPFENRWQADLGDGFWGHVAQESDFRVIMDLLGRWSDQSNDSVLFHQSAQMVDQDYAEVIVRSKLFNYSEEFFLLTSGPDLDRAVGLATVSVPMLGNSTAAQLSRLMSPRDQVGRFLGYVVERLPIVGARRMTKLKCLISDKPSDLDMEKSILAIGFEQEGVLKSEVGRGVDLRVLSSLFECSPPLAGKAG